MTVGRWRFAWLALRGRSGCSRLVHIRLFLKFLPDFCDAVSLHTSLTPTAHFRHTAAVLARRNVAETIATRCATNNQPGGDALEEDSRDGTARASAGWEPAGDTFYAWRYRPIADSRRRAPRDPFYEGRHGADRGAGTTRGGRRRGTRSTRGATGPIADSRGLAPRDPFYAGRHGGGPVLRGAPRDRSWAGPVLRGEFNSRGDRSPAGSR